LFVLINVVNGKKNCCGQFIFFQNRISKYVIVLPAIVKSYQACVFIKRISILKPFSKLLKSDYIKVVFKISDLLLKCLKINNNSVMRKCFSPHFFRENSVIHKDYCSASQFNQLKEMKNPGIKKKIRNSKFYKVLCFFCSHNQQTRQTNISNNSFLQEVLKWL